MEYFLFLIPFAADVVEEALLLVFDIPCQLQFQVGLGLPRCIPAYSDHIPILFPSGLSLFPHSMDLSLPPDLH